MKKITLIFLIIFIIFLQACVIKDNSSSEDSSIEDDIKNVNITKNEGFVSSSITKTGDLTSFKTEEEVDAFMTAPCTFIEGDNIYIIRNFPENLPEDIYSFLDNNDLKKEIEIYSVINLSKEPVRVKLKDIQDKQIVFYTLTYNKTDKTYYITGLESINDEFIPKLYKFDNDGQLQANLTLQNLNLSEIIVKSENIYYLQEILKDKIKSYDLMRYSLKDNKTSMIADLVSAFFESEGTIYYLKNETTASFDTETVLYRYDTEKDTNTSISEITANINILNACFDKVNENLYVSDGTNIYAFLIIEKKFVKVMESLQANMDILQISDTNMLVCIGHNQLSVYKLTSKPTSIEENEKPLRICYVSSQSGEAALKYEYPLNNMKSNGNSVRLEDAYIAENYTEYMNTMAKKLLSGDDDFDLFYVHTSMFELLKKQYYTDFSSFPSIINFFDSMLPGIRELCSIESQLCLVPDFISFDMMQCNNALTKETYVVPKTLDTMLSFKDNIIDNFSDSSSIFMSSFFKHSLFAPWFNQYAANFMIGNDTKESLKSLISISLSLLQDSSVYIGDNKIDSYANIIQYHGNHDNFPGEYVSIFPIPKVDDSFKYSADVSYIAINPNSKNKQLAANFLAYVIDYAADTGFTILYENTNEIDNVELFKLYKIQLQDSVRGYQNTEYMLLLADQFDQLVSGKISVDQMTDKIHNFLKMMRDE